TAALGKKDIRREVGANNPKATSNCGFGKVALHEFHPRVYIVETHVTAADSHSVGIDFNSLHGTATQFYGGNGENSRTTPNIEQSALGSQLRMLCDLLQTEPGGVVLAGAKTQAWIYNDDRLSSARTPLAPVWLYQER